MRMNEALQDVMTCDELPVYENEAKKEDVYPYSGYSQPVSHDRQCMGYERYMEQG